ncbi:MAG TPA: hypothetical protein VGW10_13985, partial [Solirubrobacteraceae bacterium]|nr:hypothetical protein [Solirubrobacteraceae bacterium]
MLRISLAIGMVLLAAGCGGGDEKDEPALAVTFAVDGAQPGPTVDALKARATAFDVELGVRETGEGRIEVTSDDDRVDARAAIARLTAPGRLAFYDWEANVIGPRGRPAPADREVTGGEAAGDAASITLYEAVERAAKRPARSDGDNSHEGLFYVVDDDRRSAAGPFLSAEAVERAARGRRAVKVEPGTVILRSPQEEGIDPKSDAWYVLEDDVALDG